MSRRPNGEDEDLRRRALAEDRISSRFESCFVASHQGEIGAAAGVLQRNLGANATRCPGDEDYLSCERLCIIVDLGIDCRIDTWVLLVSGWRNDGRRKQGCR